jgi:hypothetical protein
MKQLFVISALLLALPVARIHGQGSINFGAVPNGTPINGNSYEAVGVLLFADEGQTLYSSGSSLVASGSGDVTIAFVIPGTTLPAGVSTFSIYTADNLPGSTYQFTGFDGNNQEMFQFGNSHDYLIGDGYSFAPIVHTIVFTPSNPAYQFIDNISFGAIQPVPEPSVVTIALLGIAAFILLHREYRQKTSLQ